jgi:hypothetical protein
MASDDDGSEVEVREEERLRLLLSDEIARKYSPERLSRMVVDEAGKGERLEVGTQQEMERRIGGRFGDVRIFRGPVAEAVTKAHKADAVTIADTGMIMVREGPRADPRTALGKALLAHELTHVKQAQEGLHFALEEGRGSDAAHEREAERVESAVHAEETGGAGGAGGGAGGGGLDPATEQAVIERLLDLIVEMRRLHQSRLGTG